MQPPQTTTSPPSPIRHHVLLIGIDAYEESPLNGCVNDIDAIETVLLDRVGVPPASITKLVAPHSWHERVRRLPEAAPTCTTMRAALEALTGDHVQPQDRVLIYYAGHGTQDPPWAGDVVREALVPVDGDFGGPLLYDYELNGLLRRISERTSDLTVILDCCCSAGATRKALRPRNSTVRFLRMDTWPRRARQQGGSDLAGLVTRRTRSMTDTADDPGDPGYIVAAACQSNESATENPVDQGMRHGAFTAALLGVLAAQPDSRLATLRWADVWQLVRARVAAVYSGQHPWLVGRPERRLFGGPFERCDAGYPLTREDGRIRLAAGTLVGLTPGAKVAVYGSTPAFFPPLGSQQDHAARIGLLRIEEATLSSSTASPEGPFAWVDGARGRLVEAGRGDALVVQLDPYDADLARDLEQQGLLKIVSATQTEQEVEAFVGLDNNGQQWTLGDAIHGVGDDAEPPLAKIPRNDPAALLWALLHYAKYNQPLRLARRGRDLDLQGALRVRILNASNLSGLTPADLQDPSARLPAVRSDPNHPGGFVVEDGQQVCVVVENTHFERLYVNLLNCATSGKVEMLGTTQLEVPPDRRQTFWMRGQLGKPFKCSLPKGRASGLDRLVAVGSTVPDIDLSVFKEARSFEEAMCSNLREMADDDEEPLERWTATLATLKIKGRGERALAGPVAAHGAGAPMEGIHLFLAHADSHQPVMPQGLLASDAYNASGSVTATAPAVATSARQLITGAPPDSLRDQRWGIVAPKGPIGDCLLDLVQPLRALREQQQQSKAVVYRVDPGMGPSAAAAWIQGDLWDTVNRSEDQLPRYLLLLGGPESVSWDLQQMLAADSYVGRLAFADDWGYQAYVDKVLRCERQALVPGARALFYTVEDGSAATCLGQQHLMQPSVAIARERQAGGSFPATQIVEISGGGNVVDSAQAMLREAEHSLASVLLSLSHGAGVPRCGWASVQEQRALQGAIVLGAYQHLTAVDIAARPFLPGGIWIHLACYGAGTPSYSAYYPWLARLHQLGRVGAVEPVLAALPRPGEPPFVAALPQAALANPAGPLGVIGHVDLTWTWSFGDYDPSSGSTGLRSRAERFQGMLRTLVQGHRLGVGHHQLARFFRAVTMNLSALYDESERRGPADRNIETAMQKALLAGLWMQRQDLGAFVLLGDPAARLPIEQRPAGV